MNYRLIVLTALIASSCQSSSPVEPVKTAEVQNGRALAQSISEEKEPILGMPLTSEELAYVDSQNARTRLHLNSVTPELAKAITDRSIALLPKNAPTRVNYFGFDHIVKSGALVRFLPEGGERILIPASVLPKDASMVAYRFSPNQAYVAFAYSFFGSDWQTWQIFDLNSQTVLGQEGAFTFKGFGGIGMSWTTDSKKILYPSDTSIQADFKGQRDPKILLHTIGEPRNLDKVVFQSFEQPATSRWSAIAVSENSALVFRVQGAAVIPTAAFLIDLETLKFIPVTAINKFLGNTPGAGLVGMREGKAYLRTAEVGPNYGIVEIDLTKENPIDSTRVVVPHSPSASLYQALLVGDKILAQFIQRDLSISIGLYNLKGQKVASLRPTEYGMPDLSHPSIPFSEADKTSDKAYFTLSSVGAPPMTFVADAATQSFKKLPDTGQVPFAGQKVAMTRVFYKSHDGKNIPMLIYRRTDRAKNEATFAYLFSYGFIGVPNLPQWNRKFQLALELGAIVAIPQIRGGGEFGATSQLAGTHNREDTFKDLVHASRWLKQNEKIQGNRVVAVGRSFGGLTGAVHYVHHQSDFDAISSIVPVTDWVKHFAGAGWWMGDDFGINRDSNGRSSNQDAQALIQQVRRWDPANNLHKLAGKKLIPAIFFSGQFDTNTTPHQTFRFIKQVQAVQPQAPVYMFQHPNGGHAARAELVDEMLFLVKEFGLTEFTPLQ